MVKGVSRQVIVVHAPDPKLFDQAIFILRDDAVGCEGITDADLLKEANRIVSGTATCKKRRTLFFGLIWATFGALSTAVVWLLTAFL